MFHDPGERHMPNPVFADKKRWQSVSFQERQKEASFSKSELIVVHVSSKFCQTLFSLWEKSLNVGETGAEGNELGYETIAICCDWSMNLMPCFWLGYEILSHNDYSMCRKTRKDKEIFSSYSLSH